MKKILFAIILAIPMFISAQQGMTPEDQKRVQEIHAKRERGEQLSAEDQAFIKRMMAARGPQGGAQKGGAQKKANPHASVNEAWAKDHPPVDHTGMIPLTDLGTGKYKGEEGGLYPGGKNTPPPDHLKAGLAMARQIRPLDAEGKPSPDGKIVLMTLGISNTTMESQAFIALAAQQTDLNPHLVIIDGAQGGWPVNEHADPNNARWKTDYQRLKDKNVTDKQVQVFWIKETYPLYDSKLPFPGEAKKMQNWEIDTLHVIHDKFPNVKIAYLSSRIYAGYATVAANPEPWAYEFGFSNKWVISDQLAGKPELNYDPAKGQVRSPWLEWGPYMWADGVKPRSDGLTWVREELGGDGMHPSKTGQAKVAKMLMDFLKTDPTSKPWFVAK